MKNDNKNKARAWRLIQKRSALGKSRSYGRENKLISSIGAQRSYHSAISLYLCWREENNLPTSEQDKLCDLINFLSEIAEIFRQKTVDQYSGALAIIFKKKLPHIKSGIPENNEPRNYYLSEVLIVIQHLDEKNALAILLCYFAGFRAHEIATIKHFNEAKKSNTRKWSNDRFKDIDKYQLYLVAGKGGLVREVAIPSELAEVIEKKRYNTPKKVKDRGIYYLINYGLGFGKALSESFSRASLKHLGWSTGLHGLRHSYAQNRLYKLINLGIPFNDALKIVSEELGHFRASITLCYLR